MSVTDYSGLCPIHWLLDNYSNQYYIFLDNYIQKLKLNSLSIEDNEANTVLQKMLALSYMQTSLIQPLKVILQRFQEEDYSQPDYGDAFSFKNYAGQTLFDTANKNNHLLLGEIKKTKLKIEYNHCIEHDKLFRPINSPASICSIDSL